MRYERTYSFSAAHFNSRRAYELAWICIEGTTLLLDDLMFMVGDVHGHNFKVVCSFESDTLNEEGWLLDDVELEQVVMEWSNINLSVHPDFTASHLRATTEQMAKILLHKLERHWRDQVVLVRVYETEDIFAEAP